MSNAMSKAEANALSVIYEVAGSQVALDLPFVKKYLVRGRADLVSDQEIVLFMNTCKNQGMNPLVNGEVYLIKYRTFGICYGDDTGSGDPYKHVAMAVRFLSYDAGSETWVNKSLAAVSTSKFTDRRTPGPHSCRRSGGLHRFGGQRECSADHRGRRCGVGELHAPDGQPDHGERDGHHQLCQ